MVLKWSTFKIISSDPDLHQDHPCHVCFKLAYWFQRRRFLNIFPIGSYVKTMSTDGGHLGWSFGSLDIILKVDHLRTTWHGWSLSGQFSKLCPVTLTSIQDGHLQRTYCSFNIGPYGKKCFKILKLCLLMAAILDGGRGHRTQFWKYTTQEPPMPCLL
jgi:hypothetical protein